MITIIIGLIVVLIIVVVVVNVIQQHKEKIEKDKRAKVSKQKAIIDETEELLLNLAHMPANPTVVSILNKRSLVATKAILQIMPETKGIKSRVNEMETRLEASQEFAANHTGGDEPFVLPDNEQQLVTILQCIKKVRATLKSEQSKGALDAQVFMNEDKKFDAMQLKISVESLHKRGTSAYNKEMLGSARQYLEKALQTIIDHPMSNDYTTAKRAEIQNQLEEITVALKSTNAADREKKAKDEEDDLDMLFQPKKKW